MNNRRTFLKLLMLTSIPVFSFGKLRLHDIIEKNDNIQKINLKDLKTLNEFTSKKEEESLLLSFLSEENVYKKRANINIRNSRRLKLYNPHTKESFNKIYYINGKYKYNVLSDLNYFLRDFREKKTKNMDTELIDLVYSIQQSVSPNKPLQLLSGYRTRKTNKMLSRRTKGVAENSFHIKGRALDIAPIDGSKLKLKRIKKIAQGKSIGGVGYYGRSGFVHVDTGPIRHWG